jgi:hypothetical protein
VHGQVFALAIPVPLTPECICCESRLCVWWSCVFLLVVGSVFGEHAVFMLNLIVRGAGNWLLQNTVVTRKTDSTVLPQVRHTHTHTRTRTRTRTRTHTRTAQNLRSHYMLCVHQSYLWVRKYKTSAGKVTLLRLSLYKHWASSVQWVCPASCKACGFQGKPEWLVGCASYTATDLNTFDSCLLGGCRWQSMWSIWFLFVWGGGGH